MLDNIINSGVYKIESKVNDKIYIGSAVDLYARECVHLSLLRRNKHYNIHLQRAWNKHGEENFKFEVLITCHPSMCVWYEQQFLDQWAPKYNICSTAGSVLGLIKGPLSNKQKREISKRGKGTPKPKSYSEKLSKRMMGNTIWKGKTHSEKSKKKMSLAQMGNKKALGSKHTKEWKENMSKLMKGRTFSDETKRKMSKSRKAYFVRLKTEKEGRNNE